MRRDLNVKHYVGKASEVGQVTGPGDFFRDEDTGEVFIINANKEPTKITNDTIILRNENLSIDYSDYTGVNNIIGGFFYPRKAINPDWVSEMVREDISEADKLQWSDIEQDLDYLADNGINTLRVTIFYNLTTFGTNPLVDISQNHDQDKEAVIKGLLDRCRSRGLKIIFQTNFGYEGALSIGDLSEMQDYVDGTNESYFDRHIEWVAHLFREYSDVIIAHKIFNEPDGFGTWANYDSALTVLKFLYKLKQKFVSEYDQLPYIVNAVDHINFNLRFVEMPAGRQSIYDISDWAVFNSYYWADNGFFEFVTYRRQWDYMIENNYDDKPLLMSECGFPSDYDNQSPGEESFVPENGQFDRPQGSQPQTPHTQESQNRAIREAVYYSEQNKAIGILCWSLFKHINRTSDINFFQDSFGLIDEAGNGTTAFFDFVRAFKNDFSQIGIKPLSITGGSGSTGVDINGRNAITPNAVMAGVYIPMGGNWESEEYIIQTPYILNIRTRQKTQPADNGIAIGINFPNGGRTFLFQYEDFSNRWRLFDNGIEVASTANAGGDVALDYGTSERLISFDFATRQFQFKFDGVVQPFFDISDGTTPYDIVVPQIFLQQPFKIVSNASTADVEIIEAFLSNG